MIQLILEFAWVMFALYVWIMFYSELVSLSTHWIVCCVGTRDGVDTSEKRNICCRGGNGISIL